MSNRDKPGASACRQQTCFSGESRLFIDARRDSCAVPGAGTEVLGPDSIASSAAWARASSGLNNNATGGTFVLESNRDSVPRSTAGAYAARSRVPLPPGGEQGYELGGGIDERVSVAPDGVLGVGEGYALGVSRVRDVLCGWTFWAAVWRVRGPRGRSVTRDSSSATVRCTAVDMHTGAEFMRAPPAAAST